jgi:hypothetical protein
MNDIDWRTEMTKVWINKYYLAYQREMAKCVRQVVRQKYIAGVKSGMGGEPPLARVDTLPPPQIYSFDLHFFDGQAEQLILIWTSDDFGISSLRLRVSDEQGNHIESGYAAMWPGDPDCWFYFTTACVPPGTTVILSAVATDALGSIGMLSERTTVRHESSYPPLAENS